MLPMKIDKTFRKLQCPACGSTNIRKGHHEYWCQDCGHHCLRTKTVGIRFDRLIIDIMILTFDFQILTF